MMCCQEIMASVKSASLATATDHSLYLKIIKVTTCTWVRVRGYVYVGTCTCTLLVLSYLSHDISVFRL
jgi:hypothetical protein